MAARRPLRRATAAWGLLLVTVVLTAPAWAAPAEEETALSSPWFPETLSAGTRHACGIRNDGGLACWGQNSFG